MQNVRLPSVTLYCVSAMCWNVIKYRIYRDNGKVKTLLPTLQLILWTKMNKSHELTLSWSF